MNNKKRILSLLTALTMSASAFAGLTTSAFADGSDISYSNGKISINYTEAKDAKLIIAQYNADKTLKGVTSEAVTLTNGTTEVTKTLSDGDVVMVWDSLEGMKPLVKSYKMETVAATPTPAPTIDPAAIYYQLDFEDENTTYINSAEGKTTTVGLWASEYYYAGLSIAKDSSNADINKYMQYKNDMTARKGQRTAYYILPEAAGTLEDNQAVVEFDFKFNSGTGTNQIVLVGDSSTLIGNDLYTTTAKPAGTAPILKFNQPSTANGDFYINDTGTSVDDATAKTTGFENGKWAHAKAVMNFTTKTVILTITSLDGSKTFFETAQVAMGAGSDATKLSQLFVSAPSVGAGTVSLDNIIVRKVLDGDITATYYNATFSVDGKTTVLSGKDGEKLTSLPDTDKTGYIFDGWYKDTDTDTVLSSETVLATPLTADVTYTAVYHKDPNYVEPLASVEFSTFPTDGIPTAGADENTAASNNIQIKLTGELGNDLLTSDGAPTDERVTDFDVKWEFDGFRTIVSKALDGENTATSDQNDDAYCDSYAKVVKDTNPTKVDFQLKSQAFNFYGQVKATVTYKGKTITVSKPMSVLPTKTVVAGQLLPKAGYVSDFTPFEETMVGYQATTSTDNKDATDIVTGDWAAYGGNSGRGLYLASDETTGKKFLKLKSTGTNSSSFAANKLDAPTGQVIISQDVKFYNTNSSILYKSDNPVTWTDNATSLSLNFTGTGFNLNGGDTITDATTGVWYHIVLSADVTSKLCYAKIYDATGTTLLGESDIVPFTNAGSVTPIYLCYRTPDNANGELDFNNVKVYTPEISGDLTTTIDNETLSIPETASDEASTANLTVSAKSTENYDMIGAATWTIVDEPENVTITPDEDNSHNATLSVANGAQSGDITVRVTLGGKTKDITVALSSSQDSVSFTKSTKSISIPLTSDASDEYEYEAIVADETGAAIAGKTVTYAMYDKNNVNEITSDNALTGISFDKDTAKLTVTSEAKATTVYIRAIGTNSNDETISRSLKVTIHGLAFDLGTDSSDSLAEGYTAVAADTAYNETSGYGIESGTPTAGGTASTDDADSDNLTGSFTFKAKVEPKKVYKVTVNYSGSLASEYVNADLTGVAYTNDTQSAVTYEVPVIDDVLDLTFTNATVSSIVIEKEADKQAGGKPNVYTVGDSTIANNGSWAYCLARDIANYTDLSSIATFSNNGRGGKNLSTYYTGGELVDRVLTQVKPGDYVMIGDMGTNGMGSKFEESFNYYIDACEAMGAKVILNSYSPHGAVGGYASGYNSTTHTFTSYRQDDYDKIVRSIYAERSDATNEKYDENIIGFVDIGKMADAAFNAYVADYAANNYADEDAAAQAIIACFSDHNHYSNDTIAAQLMIEGYGTGADAKGIVKTLVEILTADLTPSSSN